MKISPALRRTASSARFRQARLGRSSILSRILHRVDPLIMPLVIDEVGVPATVSLGAIVTASMATCLPVADRSCK